MTTAATRMRELADLEGFDVELLKDGTAADLKTNGLPKYDYDRRLTGEKTVADWKARRFAKTYPGYDCRVLCGNGKEAHGNMKLSTVRESYEEP